MHPKKRYAKVDLVELYSKKAILIDIYDLDESNGIQIIFDESTAIRFAKTLRTEINKLKGLLWEIQWYFIEVSMRQ